MLFITTKNNFFTLPATGPPCSQKYYHVIKCIRYGQHQRMRMRTKNGSSHATKTSLFLFRRSLLLMRVGNLGTHCWRIWWYSFYKTSALLVLVVSCANRFVRAFLLAALQPSRMPSTCRARLSLQFQLRNHQPQSCHSH